MRANAAVAIRAASASQHIQARLWSATAGAALAQRGSRV